MAPVVQCPHSMRLRMLRETLVGIDSSHKFWKTLEERGESFDSTVPQTELAAMEEKLQQHMRSTTIEDQLLSSGTTCLPCQGGREVDVVSPPGHEEAGEEDAAAHPDRPCPAPCVPVSGTIPTDLSRLPKARRAVLQKFGLVKCHGTPTEFPLPLCLIPTSAWSAILISL